jgi:hypothetical protein
VGAAFSRDLPGQSRLKTAPTIQEQQIQNYKVSFPIRLDARGQSGACMKLHHLLQKCSYFLIKLAVFQASGGLTPDTRHLKPI